MNKEIFIDDYLDGYRSDILNCIDIPLAACAGHFSRKNYFYYCMIYPIFMNFFGSYSDSWLKLRQGLLKNLGIKLESYELTEENIRESLDNDKPSLMVLKYGSLPYSRHYKTGLYDHGVVISGYDDDKSTYVIRDREFARPYIDNGTFSSDVLFRAQIPARELRTMIDDSVSINNGMSDICNKLYSLSCENMQHPEIKDVIDSFSEKIGSARSSLESFIDYRNSALAHDMIYDKEHIDADRRRFCNSFSMLVDVGRNYFSFRQEFLEKYEVFYKSRLNLIDRIQMDMIRRCEVDKTGLEEDLANDKMAFAVLLREFCEMEEI